MEYKNSGIYNRLKQKPVDSKTLESEVKTKGDPKESIETYIKGQLFYKRLSDQTLLGYDKGKIIFIKLPDGTEESYNDQGELLQRKTPGGFFGEYENGELYYLRDSDNKEILTKDASQEMLAKPALDRFIE